MTEYKADSIEQNYNVLGTMSEADGLYYFTAKGDPRIAISGIKGMTILTKDQAKKLAKELPDMADLYL